MSDLLDAFLLTTPEHFQLWSFDWVLDVFEFSSLFGVNRDWLYLRWLFYTETIGNFSLRDEHSAYFGIINMYFLIVGTINLMVVNLRVRIFLTPEFVPFSSAWSKERFKLCRLFLLSPFITFSSGSSGLASITMRLGAKKFLRIKLGLSV